MAVLTGARSPSGFRRSRDRPGDSAGDNRVGPSENDAWGWTFFVRYDRSVERLRVRARHGGRTFRFVRVDDPLEP